MDTSPKRVNDLFSDDDGPLAETLLQRADRILAKGRRTPLQAASTKPVGGAAGGVMTEGVWRLVTKPRSLWDRLKRFDYHQLVLHAIYACVFLCVQVALPPDGGALEDAQKTTAQECFDRPEVKAYLEEAQSRILKQWITPADAAPNQRVVLHFSLNHDGSVLSVESIGSNDPKLVASGTKAIRAAGPFPVMSNRVSCLARIPITASFSPPTSKESGPP